MTITNSEDITEYSRIKKLSEFDLDFLSLQEEFKGLIMLAASIAGTKFSNLNLVDNYFQWTVASNSYENGVVPREESACDLAIKRDEPLEIPRLDRDVRFSEKGLKYYLGIPLQLNSGENIGALCVFDKEEKTLSKVVIEQLKIIAVEIVDKLEMKKNVKNLKAALMEAEKDKNRLAHDVRSPIGGISRLCEVLEEEEISSKEFKSYLEMISDAGKGILELTQNILNTNHSKNLTSGQTFNTAELGKRLGELYTLPAKTKNLELIINFELHQETRFSGAKLLSAIGNLISNAIKFTPSGGWVKVRLDIVNSGDEKKLVVLISDNGVGITNSVSDGNAQVWESKMGNNSEKGFGLGLQLVREVIEHRNGQLIIDSNTQEGTTITLKIPIG
jgi:signal transduction histidine kinase